MPTRGGTERVSPRLTCGVAAAGIVAASLFYAPILFGGSLNHHDWSSHHFNYFDWVRTSLTRFHTLPLFMNDAWVTKNFLANAEAPSLGPLVWLLFFLPTGVYIKLLFVLFTAAGLVGVFLLLRDLGVHPAIAGFAGALFAFNGFFVAHLTIGHHWAMGGQLLPWLLFLYRRAVLGSSLALAGAALLNAFTIMGGQHQPFIWQNLFLAGFACLWALERRSAAPIVRLGLLLLATLGLGAVKLLPMIAEFASYDPSERTPALPLHLLVSSLAGRGQGPDFAPPGFDFLHGSGWWEYAAYVGALGLGWMAACVLAARRGWTLLVLGLVFLVLSLEGPFFHWLEGLPVWRTQRSPSRFLLLALFCFTIVGALGVQSRWRVAFERAPRAVAAVGLALALAASLDLFLASLSWQRAGQGDPLPPRDHRPQPLRLGEPGRAVAELVDFAPNRLVYRVEARHSARIVFPFRLGEGTDEWRVDGLPASTERGKLAVDVPPGQRDVVMIYRPKLFHAGLALSAASFAALGLSFAWRSATSRR